MRRTLTILRVSLLSVAPLGAQVAIEGHLSAATQSLRLLSGIPGENAIEFTGTGSGLDAYLFAVRYRVGLQLQRSAASSAAVNAGTYEATYRFYRLGGRLSAPLGTTGFSVGARASFHVPADFDTEDGATGLDAGTHLRWTSARFPVKAALEYRSERFTVADGVHQELSAVSFGVGFAFRTSR